MIPSRKIIVFMDFDGVLNSDEFFRQRDDNGNGRDHSNTLSVYYDVIKSVWDAERLHPVKLEGFLRNMSRYNFSNYMMLLSLLRQIYGGVSVVLSTSWRNAFSVKDWNTIFKKLPGWNFDIIGVIPSDTTLIPSIHLGELSSSISNVCSRFGQIMTYINQNSSMKNDRVLILDDDDIFDEYESISFTKIKQQNNKMTCIHDNILYFQTDRETGLTFRNVKCLVHDMVQFLEPLPRTYPEKTHTYTTIMNP